MYQITGNTTVIVNTNETYGVSPIDGTGHIWSVTGGNIISGQNTPSITVHWTTPGKGDVKVAVQGGGLGDGGIIIIDIDD